MKTPTRLCAAALAACALLLAPAPSPLAALALAESETAGSSVLQTSKKANMRKEPDKKSDIREAGIDPVKGIDLTIEEAN